MMKMWKLLTVLFFIVYSLFLIPKHILAADFRNDYQVEYFLTQSQNTINAHVKFTIAITNLTIDTYIKRYFLIFPRSFTIRNIHALANDAPVTPQLSTENTDAKIGLPLDNAQIGYGLKNTINVEFDQDNLFKVNGNVWEVILPVFQSEEKNNYTVTVHLPENINKKIAIAKPKPDSIDRNLITWKNPEVKTIYAVFGNQQYYHVQLKYHLKNPKLVPAYTDVAFPPDTLYQKVYLNSVEPAPFQVGRDIDENWLAKYILKPKEEKDITLDQTVIVYNDQRNVVEKYEREKITNQKQYLLSSQKYWQVDTENSLSTPKDIYSFLTTNFKYDYAKLTSNTGRLGAKLALIHPDQVVCTEYTDTFIALAREKGIYSREIEGYAYSADQDFRPLSFQGDILHAWPEYYDSTLQIWQPIDPTWGSTSGIDYFSSFDLNHIAFVIHGQNPDYPLPGGEYKQKDTKDVTVTVASAMPEDKVQMNITDFSYASTINGNKAADARFTIRNNSNIYVWDYPVQIKGDNIAINSSNFTIPVLAPMEEKQIKFQYTPLNKNKISTGTISVASGNTVLATKEIKIWPVYITLLKYVGILIIIVVITNIVTHIRKKKN